MNLWQEEADERSSHYCRMLGGPRAGETHYIEGQVVYYNFPDYEPVPVRNSWDMPTHDHPVKSITYRRCYDSFCEFEFVE